MSHPGPYPTITSRPGPKTYRTDPTHTVSGTPEGVGTPGRMAATFRHRSARIDPALGSDPPGPCLSVYPRARWTTSAALITGCYGDPWTRDCRAAGAAHRPLR